MKSEIRIVQLPGGTSREMGIEEAKMHIAIVRLSMSFIELGYVNDGSLRTPEFPDGFRSPDGVEIALKEAGKGVEVVIAVPVDDCRSDRDFVKSGDSHASWLQNKERMIINFDDRKGSMATFEKIIKLVKSGEGIIFFNKEKLLPLKRREAPPSHEEMEERFFSYRALMVRGSIYGGLVGTLSHVGIAGKIADALEMSAIRGNMYEIQNAVEKAMQMKAGALNTLMHIGDIAIDGIIAGIAGAIMMTLIGRARYGVRLAARGHRKRQENRGED